MFCNKCGNEIKEGELFCPKCGNKIGEEDTQNKNTEQEHRKKTNKKLTIILVVIIVLCVIACAVLGIFLLSNKDNKNGSILQIGANGQVVSTKTLSFSNMKSGNKNLKLDDTQYDVLRYFDNNYIGVYKSEDLQRYPKVYQDAQVKIDCVIKKVIKSTNDEFICMGVIGYEGFDSPEGELESYEESELFVIKSKQLDERYIKDDEIIVYGIYTGVEEFEVNGKTYTVPVINSIYSYDIAKERRFNLDDITKVAKYIFGNDIKITEPADTQAYGYSAADPMYIVTLDNQTNANFKEFAMLREIGYIGYTSKDFVPINKHLFISADFQHFIVTTHEESTKKLYMDYYDKDFNKIWGREFDYKSSDFDIYSTPMDYTASQLSVVIDNDLYLIDLTTGENVIEPVLVGNKIAISMLSDRILLIGNDNKDAIMMVDYKGNVIKKMNADTTMDSIYSADMQIVNNRIVIILSGSKELDYYTEYSNTEYLKKYIVLDSEGNVELSTKDTNEY